MSGRPSRRRVSAARILRTVQPIEVPAELEREPIAIAGLDHRGNALSGAIFSPDGVYRYALHRHIGAGRGSFVVIGLNPSTADETKDDPTIRRCMSFAKREGKSRLVMLNLFAFRATDPGYMKLSLDPIGPENDAVIAHYATLPDVIIVAAWGVHGHFRNRATEVGRELPVLVCFGQTKDGHPRHPLYLRKDTPLVPLEGEVAS
jgi:hypothetical protein